MEERLSAIQSEAAKDKQTVSRLQEIRAVLGQELTFQNGINSALVTTILDHIVVKKCSAKEALHLDIHLRFGGPWRAVFDREKSSFCFNPSLTGESKGKELWKAHGQKVCRRNKGEMVCHYAVIWDGQARQEILCKGRQAVVKKRGATQRIFRTGHRPA